MLDGLPMAKARGFPAVPHREFTVAVLGVGPDASGTVPASGPRHSAHLEKPQESPGPERFFRMRSTFYVPDFLPQRPMLSVKEPCG